MSTTELFVVGRTQSGHIRFVQEAGDGSGVVTVAIEPRDWDVNDPEAREAAGRDLLGDDYDHHHEHQSAQWWIDVDRNAAGLAVYQLRGNGEVAR